MSIYKDCDIRGLYGSELTVETVRLIGNAVAARLAGKDIVVGGDFRVHTPALKEGFIQGLLEGGAQVIDVGQLSTPQLYFSKNFLGTYASAQITASHNPPEYNGIKLMFGDLPVQPEDILGLRQSVEMGVYIKGKGSLRHEKTTQAYVEMLIGTFAQKYKGNGSGQLKLVIDAGNGAMGEIAPFVMRKLDFDVVELFCEIDGRFPNRDPNPAVLANLSALKDKVREEHADFGAAFDGDGDRIVFIDGKGTPLNSEESMVIFINALMKKEDSVVYDIKSSSILKQAVEKREGRAIMERSGHAFIRRTFLENDSRLAGEVSGHFFFRELGGDDGLFALVNMAGILCQTGQPIRDLLNEVHYTQITPDIRIKATKEQIAAAFEQFGDWIKEHPEAIVSELDGLRMEFPNGDWILLRKSVTEPAFTLRMEAQNAERLKELRLLCKTKMPVLEEIQCKF